MSTVGGHPPPEMDLRSSLGVPLDDFNLRDIYDFVSIQKVGDLNATLISRVKRHGKYSFSSECLCVTVDRFLIGNI